MKSTKVIKDAETKYVPASKSGGGGCLEARVSSGLASSTLQSASAQPFLYRPTRGSPSPLPPLTPGHRWWMEGFPVPLSVFISSPQSVAGYLGMYVPRVSRLLDGFGFGLQSHPAPQISSASAQKSPEMGRPCDSNLGNNQNCSGHHGKNLK